MASANKKVTYNSDFKLKVLDYYLRNGGDSKYGLKTKTCALFNINKKTINRLLENPEMVKRAKKVMGRKGIPGTKGTPVKVVKPGSKTLGRPPLNKPSSKVASGKQSSSGNSKASNIGNTSYGTSGTNKQKATGLGSNSSNTNITDKTSRQTNLSPQKDAIGKENASLFDIPDNPDFSILKRPINSSASSNASSIARLLVTGTKEVQNMLLNECEIIFECKVCRNLFRSIVNFLAHKRIYCRDNYTEVKGLFRKEDLCGMTTESATVVVEPEPPPVSSTHKETWATSDNSFSWRSRNRRRRIDNIADTLSRKNKEKVESSPTSASDKGSSYYHQRIGNITAERAKVTRDCSVTLENIVGVSNAVYQTYTPPDTIASSADYEATHAKIRKQQKGQTAEISKSGKAIPMTTEEVDALEPPKNPEKLSPIKQHICGQCNQQFATAKTLRVHQGSVHNNERTIFPCPICATEFLSMWAVVKHLHKYHQKNKPQRERLRKVIRKNSYKKILTEAEEGAVQKAAEDMEKEEEEGNEEEEAKTSNSEIPSYNTQTDKSQKETQENYKKMDIDQEDGDYDDNHDDNHDDKDEEIPKRREMNTPQHSDKSSPLKVDTGIGCESQISPEHHCAKCERMFNNSSALSAHGKFCSLTPMMPEILPESPLSPRLRSETPEKKIAIQIRKDYEKTSTHSKVSDEIMPHQVTFKVPKTPGEMKVESMLAEFCDIQKLICKPCKKTYKSICSLKRHASQHFTWTRFLCQKCNLRTFHRYECVRHAMFQHKLIEAEAHSVVMDHEEVGSLKYYLINEEGVSIASDAEDSESVSSIHSPVFGIEIRDKSIDILKKNEASEEKVIKRNVCDKLSDKNIGTANIEIEENKTSKSPVKQKNIESDKNTGTENIEIEEKITSKTPEKQKYIENKTVTNIPILKIDEHSKSMETSVNGVPYISSSSTIQNNLELNSLSKKKVKTLRQPSILSVIQNLQQKVKIEHTNGDSVLDECVYPVQEFVTKTNTGTNGAIDSGEYRSERPIRNRKSVEKTDFVYNTSPRTSSVVETNKESPKNMAKRKQVLSPQVGNSGKKYKQNNEDNVTNNDTLDSAKDIAKNKNIGKKNQQFSSEDSSNLTKAKTVDIEIEKCEIKKRSRKKSK